MSESSPKVVFANGNVAQSPLALASMETLGRFVTDAGFDGVEWHPLFRSARSVVEAVDSGVLQLNSLHQTFRTNRHSRDTNRFGGNPGLINRLIDSPLGGLMMPEVVASADYIAEIQTGINQSLPVVFFPQEQATVDRVTLNKVRASLSLFQATDHVARLVYAQDFRQFEDVMLEQRGYDGFVFDTLHVRRTYGSDPGIVSRNPFRLLEHTRAVHLSLNRLDFAKSEPHILGKQELDDALSGEFTGFHRDVLDAVREQPQVKYVVVELASGALKRQAAERRLTVQQGYSQIAGNLRNFLER